MKKLIPLLFLLPMLFVAACGGDSAAKKAEMEKAAADGKEAMALDSISKILEQEKAEIDESIQKLEENLKAIEE